MSLISDMLKSPLPSKTRTVTEEYDDTRYTGDTDDELDDGLNYGDDDDNLENLSDDELDALADSIISSEVDELVGDVPEEELSPEEERDADDMMGVAATTAVVQSELNATEQAALLETMTDLQIAIDEGLLMESDVEALKMSLQPFTEAAFSPKTKVKFSLNDKKAQLYSVALNVCARAHNDPDYRKLQKIYKARRVLRAKLEKKYHAEATKRMKVYIQRLRSSKSGILASIGKKLGAKENND